MGQDSGSSTIEKSASPWAPIEPALRQGVGQLSAIYGTQSGGPAPTRDAFTNTTPGSGYWAPRNNGSGGGDVTWVSTPGSSTFDEAGYNAALARYQNQTQQAMPQSYNLSPGGAEVMRNTIAGNYLNNNPYIDDVLRSSASDVNSQFEGMGRYGSGVHQDALARSSSAIRYGNYLQERQNQLQAVQQAPAYELAPYDTYAAQVAAPYENISRYINLLNTAGRGGGSQTEVSPLSRNRLAGGLGGAAAGAGLAYTLGASNPYIGAAAAAGGLLGAYA